jgi:hypothetical protein
MVRPAFHRLFAEPGSFHLHLLPWMAGLVGHIPAGHVPLQPPSPQLSGVVSHRRLFLALEWHLVWAAASGMETLLFSLLALAVLALLISASSQKIPPPFRGGQGGGILHRQGEAGGDSSNNLPPPLGGGEGGVSFTDKDGPVEASILTKDSPPLTKGGLGGDSSNNLPLPLGGGKGGVFLHRQGWARGGFIKQSSPPFRGGQGGGIPHHRPAHLPLRLAAPRRPYLLAPPFW